jgi:hypothetical protein
MKPMAKQVTVALTSMKRMLSQNKNLESKAKAALKAKMSGKPELDDETIVEFVKKHDL